MEIIKIESYEDFQNKFSSLGELHSRHELMECSKEVAEKILNKSIDDEVCNSDIRCTNCGCNMVSQVYEIENYGKLDRELGYVVYEEGESSQPIYKCSDCNKVYEYVL